MCKLNINYSYKYSYKFKKQVMHTRNKIEAISENH